MLPRRRARHARPRDRRVAPARGDSRHPRGCAEVRKVDPRGRAGVLSSPRRGPWVCASTGISPVDSRQPGRSVAALHDEDVSCSAADEQPSRIRRPRHRARRAAATAPPVAQPLRRVRRRVSELTSRPFRSARKARVRMFTCAGRGATSEGRCRRGHGRRRSAPTAGVTYMDRSVSLPSESDRSDDPSPACRPGSRETEGFASRRCASFALEVSTR